MKINILFVFIFIFVGAYSQVYHSFLNQSCWYQQILYMTGPKNYWIYTANDTMVNGKNYKKIKESDIANNAHLIREDTISKRVYGILMFSSSEILLYDFSLNEGDPFIMSGGMPTTVSKIDSVLTNDGYRKRFTITINSSGYPVRIIEGVGSVENPMRITTGGGDPGYRLICSYQNTKQVYQLSGVICPANPYVLSINDPNKKVECAIFPNPFTDKVNFEITGAEGKIFSLIIYDALGRAIKKVDKITTSQFTLDRGGMENGIYFYELSSESSIINRGKLVVK